MKNGSENFLKNYNPDSYFKELKRNNRSEYSDKEKIISHKLSPEFLESEADFTRSLFKKLIKGYNLINDIENWAFLDQSGKEVFLKNFIKNISEASNLKYDIHIEFSTDGKGIYHQSMLDTHFLFLPKDLNAFKSPEVLISALAHEILGHGRGYEKYSSMVGTEEDKNAIRLQNMPYSKYYIQANEDINLYKSQPSEVHARHVQKVFIEELIKLKPDLEGLQQEYKRLSENKLLNEIKTENTLTNIVDGGTTKDKLLFDLPKFLEK
ncbi:MAG: hypothetical protein SFT90_08080 [Rickettsiales bacterium]|nr:hypothetical protein [Rickettsiales bacterium]